MALNNLTKTPQFKITLKYQQQQDHVQLTISLAAISRKRNNIFMVFVHMHTHPVPEAISTANLFVRYLTQGSHLNCL